MERSFTVCMPLLAAIGTFRLGRVLINGAATLVHAFVTSRIDYGNALLANAPKIWTDKLQRVLNAAPRVITGTRKFNSSLSHILHRDLHWLDVPQHVIFKLCMTVYKCLHGLAPKYLAELCVPVADVAGRRQLLYVLLAEDFWIFLATTRQTLTCTDMLTCILFRRSLRLELTSWAYPAININSCLQALTKDISTPADIAPGYVSALTYYLLCHAHHLSTFKAIKHTAR